MSSIAPVPKPPPLNHRILPADAHLVPPPFRAFAVRSEEPCHDNVARAPYGRVHLITTGILDAQALQSLVALGRSKMHVQAFSDFDYAPVTLAELAEATPGVRDLLGDIATALSVTGVLGADAHPYRHSVAARIDYLASVGAGFHNDVSRHWTGCLFWNLTLAASNVEFVMPHAGVRVALAPGDLIVFDPALVHGLCRTRDHGQAQPASFATIGDADAVQIFLSGELPLSDAQWAAIGAPWLPVEVHHDRAALELMAAEFDERTGAIQRVHALADCLLRSTRYVDDGKLPATGG